MYQTKSQRQQTKHKTAQTQQNVLFTSQSTSKSLQKYLVHISSLYQKFFFSFTFQPKHSKKLRKFRMQIKWPEPLTEENVLNDTHFFVFPVVQQLGPVWLKTEMEYETSVFNYFFFIALSQLEICSVCTQTATANVDYLCTPAQSSSMLSLLCRRQR